MPTLESSSNIAAEGPKAPAYIAKLTHVNTDTEVHFKILH